MAVPYIEIDSNFVSNLDINLKLKLFRFLLKDVINKKNYSNIEELLDKSNRSSFFMFCPYCNNIALLTTAKSPSIIEKFVDKIGELFQEEFEKEMHQRIEVFLQE